MFSYQTPTPKADSTPVIRTDAVPTEAQMKLAIAQTLSQSFAYNAPVIVLDFEVDDDGGMTGRFKDAARPRVFSFEIDGESVSYKPFKPGRMDSVEDVEEWEEFSEGYAYRVDAGARAGGKKAQCVKPTAYNCGSACINVNNNCKANTGDAISKKRLNKLKDLSMAYAKNNDGDKFAKTNKKIADIQTQRSAKAKSLLEERANKKKSKESSDKPLPKKELPSNAKVPGKSNSKLKSPTKTKAPTKAELEETGIKPVKDPAKWAKKFLESDKNEDLTQKQTPVKSSQSKKDDFYSDEPIKDYDTFKKEIPKELARVNFEYNLDGLIPISKMREELKGRVNDKDFDKWMLDAQAENDDIMLTLGGKTAEPGGIKTQIGAERDLIKFTDKKAIEKARDEIKRKPGQIIDQKEFNELANKALDELTKKKDYGNLIPIYEVRRAMGDKVSRGDFNKLLVEMQASDQVQLIGGAFSDETKPGSNKKDRASQIEDSIETKLGGMRYYVKRLK